MSSLEPEEDTELRDLVANTLQTCGVLGKIKAQLRSNVYLALDGGESQLRAKSTLSNHGLSNFSKTSEGRLVLSLVREFLTFLKLDCTLSVFEAEAIEGRSLQGRSREELIDKLGLVNERIGERHGSSVFDKAPLLSEVLRLSKVSILKSETPSPTENSHRTEEEESSLRSSAIDESGTAKSSLTHGTGNRNTNGHGGMGGNTGLYGINDRSNPGSIATTPQSLTPESSLNPTATSKFHPNVPIPPTVTNYQIPTESTINITSGSTVSSQSTGNNVLHKKVPKEIQAPLATMLSGDSNTQNTSHQLATSKSSSTSSSFSSIDQSLPERHQSKGVFSTQSSLGDLPPLGGQLSSNARNTLAPLKKTPSSSSVKSSESNLSKDKKNVGIHDLYGDLEMSDKSSNTNKSKTKSSKHDTEEMSGSGNITNAGGSKENYGADINLSKSTKSVLGSRSNSFSRTNSKMSNDPIIGKDEKLDSNDDDIDEDIDNFLDSQASGDIGGSEDDFTKDETVASGEETSMKADYVLDLRS